MNSLSYEVRPAAGEPEGALVLHHGRGADGRDLIPLIEALDPERRLVGVTPQGPLQLPPGGWHWYIVQQVGYPDPSTFRESCELLAALHDSLPEQLGVPWQRTVIGGFSQGTVMSYALGLAKDRPAPAGLLALSGFIPSVPDWAPYLADRSELPVMIAHGSADAVISVDFARAARQTLEQGGLPVTYREAPVGHGIDPAMVPELRAWLADRF